MCEIIDIRGDIHEANVRRIARGVLDVVGSSPRDKDLVDAIQYKIPELNNWFLVVFIINRCFPSPALTKVQYPSVIEDIVIEVLVREGLINRKRKIAKP
jgi:hypothetical protein